MNNIDTTGWGYLYKLDYGYGHNTPTNMLYTPMLSPAGDILCMVWDENHPYQSENRKLSKDLINFFFEREVKYLKRFQGSSWAPELIQIDYENKKIFIEFNKETLNHIVVDKTRDIHQEFPNYTEEIFNILKDIVDAGYYKMALYPHCFFIDKNNKLKTIDFYSCASFDERYLELNKIEGMIGNQSVERFASATTDGVLDFEIFFKNTLTNHLGGCWAENPFPEFYKRLFNE